MVLDLARLSTMRCWRIFGVAEIGISDIGFGMAVGSGVGGSGAGVVCGVVFWRSRR